MRVNFDSAVHMLQAWITALQSGLVSAVFASSVVARIDLANHEAFAAAKGGVKALVRSAAATYAAQGVRINADAPDMTETIMTPGTLKLDERAFRRSYWTPTLNRSVIRYRKPYNMRHSNAHGGYGTGILRQTAWPLGQTISQKLCPLAGRRAKRLGDGAPKSESA
jgi:NAD(P)-dependent dehydrogenase (short-subunit alcohol dehydrogenase family)